MAQHHLVPLQLAGWLVVLLTPLSAEAQISPGALGGARAIQVQLSVESASPASVKIAPGESRKVSLTGKGLGTSGLAVVVRKKDGSATGGRVKADLGKAAGSTSRAMTVRADGNAYPGNYRFVLQGPAGEVTIPFQADVTARKAVVPVGEAPRAASGGGTGATPALPPPVPEGTVKKTRPEDPKERLSIPVLKEPKIPAGALKGSSRHVEPLIISPTALGDPDSVWETSSFPAPMVPPVQRASREEAPNILPTGGPGKESHPYTDTAPASLPVGSFGRKVLAKSEGGAESPASPLPGIPANVSAIPKVNCSYRAWVEGLPMGELGGTGNMEYRMEVTIGNNTGRRMEFDIFCGMFVDINGVQEILDCEKPRNFSIWAPRIETFLSDCGRREGVAATSILLHNAWIRVSWDPLQVTECRYEQ